MIIAPMYIVKTYTYVSNSLFQRLSRAPKEPYVVGSIIYQLGWSIFVTYMEGVED